MSIETDTRSNNRAKSEWTTWCVCSGFWRPRIRWTCSSSSVRVLVSMATHTLACFNALAAWVRRDYTHTYIDIHSHTRTRTHTHTRTHAHVHSHTSIHTHTYIHRQTIQTFIHTYTHTRTHQVHMKTGKRHGAPPRRKITHWSTHTHTRHPRQNKGYAQSDEIAKEFWRDHTSLCGRGFLFPS